MNLMRVHFLLYAAFALVFSPQLQAASPSSDKVKVSKAPAKQAPAAGSKSEKLAELEKKAAAGDANSQYNFGIYYLNRGDVKGYQWLAKAAEQGHAKAQFFSVNACLLGRGVPRSGRKAIHFLQESAKQNHPQAQACLGAFYAEGFLVERNLHRAYDWYTKAAEQGLPYAHYYLGKAHEEGKVVKKDLKKAFAWYTKAANEGAPEGQYALGQLLWEGRGTKRDVVKASAWMHLAQNARGFPAPEARMQSKIYRSQISKSQLKQAEALAMQIKKSISSRRSP